MPAGCCNSNNYFLRNNEQRKGMIVIEMKETANYRILAATVFCRNERKLQKLTT
jgi:hypothetical protein